MLLQIALEPADILATLFDPILYYRTEHSPQHERAFAIQTRRRQAVRRGLIGVVRGLVKQAAAIERIGWDAVGSSAKVVEILLPGCHFHATQRGRNRTAGTLRPPSPVDHGKLQQQEKI